MSSMPTLLVSDFSDADSRRPLESISLRIGNGTSSSRIERERYLARVVLLHVCSFFISIVVVTIVGFSTSLIPRFFLSDFSDTDLPIPLEPIKCVVQF